MNTAPTRTTEFFQTTEGDRMKFSVNVKGFREYITKPRYNYVKLFFAMQAVAISERFHVFFGVLVLFLGFVVSAALEGKAEKDPE